MSRAKDRLRNKGIAACEVSASRVILVPHTSLVMAPKGDPLFDPRSLDPVREDLAQDMAARVQAGDTPNTDAILVREQPDGLLVVDGHGRGKALVRAAEIIGLTGNAHLMCFVEFFTGDDKALLLERARRNDHGRFARADKPSTLAFRVRQLTAIGATEREIADACPRGVGPAEVEALTRWNNLAADARQRFEDGAPIGLLAAVLEVPKGEQVARLEKLLAAGVRTGRAATKRANEERDGRDPWARRMSPKALDTMAGLLIDRFPLETRTVSAFGVALGMRLGAATGDDAEALLKKLPKPIADAIREARAAKPAKGAR
jgi:hypothetical protein